MSLNLRFSHAHVLLPRFDRCLQCAAVKVGTQRCGHWARGTCDRGHLGYGHAIPGSHTETAGAPELRECDVATEPQLIVAASRLEEEHTLSFWDALIVQAAILAGADRLVSEDLQDGRRFGALTQPL